MDNTRPLVFIPTYNEKENVPPLFARIMALGLPLDILFLDDNSPDGTGKIMDELAAEYSNVAVIHRSGKLGIGSAHKEGILWAYERGYSTLVTMDADFTHAPEKIPDLLAELPAADIVVTSRYLMKESLKGWNPMRKVLTNFAHFLTTVLLGLKYDSTGAFRVYRLDRVPSIFVKLVRSNGYSFFFESLHLLNRGGFHIAEIPIVLSSRTYGSSKMDYSEIFKSVRQLVELCSQTWFQKNPWGPYRALLPSKEI